MAMCTHQVLAIIGVDDPGVVGRVAVRFASPTRIGGELTVDAYGIAPGSFSFEATCDGAKVDHPRTIGVTDVTGLDIAVWVSRPLSPAERDEEPTGVPHSIN